MSSTNSKVAVPRKHRRKRSSGVDGAPAPRHDVPYFRWKIAIDFTLVLALLIPSVACIALLVLLVRLTSKGPGIYRQIRSGKDGRQFTMFKIRTMGVDAETRSGPIWTQSNDLRVTFVGRILRKLHLDELPQIFNVLRGDMSFVGPRPERPEFVRVLSEVVPRYRDRLVVRPGITGLAQINLPPDSDVMSVRRKLALDLDYIENASFGLDVRLLLCTILRVVKIHEGFLTWSLRLQRDKLLAAMDSSADTGLESTEATPETILLQAVQDASANGADGEASSVDADEGNDVNARKPR